jgi:hypothetical protein
MLDVHFYVDWLTAFHIKFIVEEWPKVMLSIGLLNGCKVFVSLAMRHN